MFGFLGDIMAFFGAVKAFLVMGMVGAIAAVIGAVIHRILGGATGLLAAALAGALIIGWSSASDYFQSASNARMQAKVAALEAENKAKQTSLALANASKAELERAVSEAQTNAERNADVMAELEQSLKDKAETGECSVTDEELEIIRKLQ